MFTTDRKQTRRPFFLAWEKFQKKLPLDALESQIIEILAAHPEYHELLSNPDKYIDKDYLSEMDEPNPFLHLSMHMAVRDQLRTNKPLGIKKIFTQLAARFHGDTHETEHKIACCLIEMISDMQNTGCEFNEKKYLKKIKKLLRG